MTKSVKDMVMEVLIRETTMTVGSSRRLVDALAAAGLLATDALLECGEACIAFPRESHSGTRIVRAAAALAAEREGKPPPAPTPSTAEVDAKLYETLAATGWECTRETSNVLPPSGATVAAAFAACRKAREPRNNTYYHRGCNVYDDGGWVSEHKSEAQARAVADALNALEAK